MGIHIRRIPGEPTIILTLQEPTETLYIEINEACRRVAALARAIPGIYYRVIDFSHTELTFPELMAIINQEMISAPGTLTDPRAHTMLVGDAEITELTVTALRAACAGSIHVERFTNLEDALYFTAAARLAV